MLSSGLLVAHVENSWRTPGFPPGGTGIPSMRTTLSFGLLEDIFACYKVKMIVASKKSADHEQVQAG